MRRTRYGQSTLRDYTPGFRSTMVDPSMVHPRTSTEGVRGADVSLLDGDDELEFDLEELDAESENDVDEAAEREERMGRLYTARPYGKPLASTRADPGVLTTKSGWTGHRGGRDRLGTSLVQEPAPESREEYGQKPGGSLDDYQGGYEDKLLLLLGLTLLWRMA